MTLIEVLVALSIMALISAVTLSSFSEYRSRQAKDAAAEAVLSTLGEARLDTISSKFDDTYGVRLKSDEAIYFKGSTYPGDTDIHNIHFYLPTSIEIANVNLNGGGDMIYYQRLTGATMNYGTFEVRVKNNPALSILISVNQTGASSI